MNYYNEFDPYAAEWLRNLIEKGLIPNGIVDTRSIAAVDPVDILGFTQCHFFAGIGGWALALDLAGWPRDRPVWTGSCPCQPFSTAGRQKGVEDERHLWPVFLKLIAACRPEFVFGEQVASAIGHGWLDLVQADMGREGYACRAAVLGAHSVGAPHLRQRLYLVGSALAHPSHNGQQRGSMGVQAGEGQAPQGRRENEGSRGNDASDGSGAACGLADAASERHDGRVIWHPCRDGKFRSVPAQPALLGVADGLPRELVRVCPDSFPLTNKKETNRIGRLKGYGNAIVPQVAAAFIKASL